MTKAAEILEECFRKVDNSAGPVSDHGAKSIESKQDIQGRTHSSSKSESNPQGPYPEEWRVTINKCSSIAIKNDLFSDVESAGAGRHPPHPRHGRGGTPQDGCQSGQNRCTSLQH